MKKTFNGNGHTPGSTYKFEGNSQVGSGELALLSATPSENVKIKLTMLTPFKAENEIEYRLVPEADGTRFHWIMSGDGGFLGKLVTTLIDCEKLATADWDRGIENLKRLVEKPAP